MGKIFCFTFFHTNLHFEDQVKIAKLMSHSISLVFQLRMADHFILTLQLRFQVLLYFNLKQLLFAIIC